jgi:hypothetical protein
VWTRAYDFSCRLDDPEARRQRVKADNTLDKNGTHARDVVVDVAAVSPMILDQQPTKQKFWLAVERCHTESSSG